MWGLLREALLLCSGMFLSSGMGDGLGGPLSALREEDGPLLPNPDPHGAELMMFVTSFMKASSNTLHETDQTKTHFPSLLIWL